MLHHGSGLPCSILDQRSVSGEYQSRQGGEIFAEVKGFFIYAGIIIILVISFSDETCLIRKYFPSTNENPVISRPKKAALQFLSKKYGNRNVMGQ